MGHSSGESTLAQATVLAPAPTEGEDSSDLMSRATSSVARLAGVESAPQRNGGDTMSNVPKDVASVVALWRYPVKSMMGEELNSGGYELRPGREIGRAHV